MKLKLVLSVVSIFILNFSFAGSASRSGNICDDPPQTGTGQVQTITETMKVVKTEPATNTITVSNSYIHTFTIDPKTIDLRKFQVGDKVTATLQVTTTIDRLTKAKSTKEQLLKLQK